MTSIADTIRKFGIGLLLWSIANFIIGVALHLGLSGTLLSGIGFQSAIWGLIDGTIAAFILLKQNDQSIKRMARILEINLYLDIVYQIVGVVVILAFFQNQYAVGNGVGIFIQGLFLLIFDYLFRSSLLGLQGSTEFASKL